MPNNTASGWREKGVLVAVYVEIPRKNSGHHHHRQRRQHRRHLFVHQKPRQGRGFNRRAELLEYSRRLRESTKPHKTPLLKLEPKPVETIQRSRSQIIPAQKKSARVPTCFGALTIRLPRFSNTKREKEKRIKTGQSTKDIMKSIVRSLRVQRKGGFFSRMFGSLRRKR